MEELHILYLPSYPVEDYTTRLAASKAITKEVVLVTGTRPTLTPLDKTVLQKSSLDENSRIMQMARTALRKNSTNTEEKAILQLFLKTLRVPGEDFNIDTPFYEAGITSIELIQLKRNVKEGLGLDEEIPMITLINHPTVRSLAAELRKSEAVIEYKPVITLQSEENRTPLWLIHPGVSEVLVFVALAKFVNKQKVYALRARGLNPGEEYFESIEEAVNIYHKSIKRKQPIGPYTIAGYSYGTVLAFETAKLLESKGGVWLRARGLSTLL